jgi:inner membrane protein
LPTLITHPVVPLSIAYLAGPKAISGRLLWAAVIASVVPDLDVIGLAFAIPYEHPMGHRGFSHSIGFAVLMGLCGLVYAKKLKANRTVAFLVLFVSTLSHGLLDALTNGGLGIAFFSPFTNDRYFFSWRPIRVSPMELEPFFQLRGWRVLVSEVVWVWFPALFLSFLGMRFKRRFSRRTTGKSDEISSARF